MYMHGVHLWGSVRFALKLRDKALSPLLYTRYVNRSWVSQVQQAPLLPRKHYWDLMMFWVYAFSSILFIYYISVYSYSNQCLTQKIPSTKQRWRAEHIHAVIHLHYPVFLRHLVVFKFLFHRTFRQILEGRNEQTNTELTQILTKDLYRAQLVLCRMPDNK